MKSITMIVLVLLTIAFWYGVYASIGMWVWVFILSAGISQIGIFYILTKNKK